MKLQDMRNPRHLRWPLYFLFAIVCVSFIFFYGWHQSEADRNPNIFAKMKSESLSPFKRWTYIRRPQMQEAQTYLTKSIERMYIPQWLVQSLQRQGTLKNLVERLVTSDEVAREAADMILMERAARDMGISVTREDIITQLRSIPNMTDQALDAQVRDLNLGSREAFIDYIRKTSEMEQVKRIKELAAQASHFELWQEYGLRNDKFTLQIAAFSNDDFTSKVLVTDQDAQKYYDEHREDYRIPTQRRYLYIKLGRDDVSKKISPTEDQIDTFYKENPDRYHREAAVMLNELQLKVPSGDSIGGAMRFMDDLRSSATATRDWNALANEIRNRDKIDATRLYERKTEWYTQQTAERPASYMTRVMALSGDTVSTPILTTQIEDGFTTTVTLARVVGRRDPGVAPLAEIADEVKRDFTTQETDRLFKERTAQWKAARDKAKNMAELAKTLGMDDHITTMVDANDYKIEGVGTFQENSDYIGGLTQRTLSDPIPTDDGNLVVLEPTDSVESHIPPMAEVRSKIVAAIQGSRAGDLARAAAQNALQVVQGGAAFDNALADAPIKPTVTEPQTRMDPVKVLKAPLIDFQRQTLRAARGTVGMSPFGNDKNSPMGYAVWRVVDMEPVGRDKFRADLPAFRRDYVEVQQLSLVNEWLKDQRARADFELEKENQKNSESSE